MGLDILKALQEASIEPAKPVCTGRVTRVLGVALEAQGLKLSLGDYCKIKINASRSVEAEVVGFDGPSIKLMPLSSIEGIEPNARVMPILSHRALAVGEGLLGRVVNALGHPIDGKGTLEDIERWPWEGEPINPLDRAPIEKPIDVGIHSINAFNTLGRGQRVGLLAGSGVGKSVLLGMMTRFTQADVVVVGLIGERGREVAEFIRHSLGEAGMKKAVVVAAPADESPMMRLKAAETTHRIAEWFRDKGKHTLLLMDSLTRYGQAQREIALATGEMPASKGYPSSVFSKLPKLVERSGNGPEGGGSITAIYTVLAEGDDLQDPIVDASRAILDGHIVLSRKLAERGHYPAVDIERSVSRVMPQVVDMKTLSYAHKMKSWLSRYAENEDLVAMGAYQPGRDIELDRAMAAYPQIMNFTSQAMHEAGGLKQSLLLAKNLVNEIELSNEPDPAQE